MKRSLIVMAVVAMGCIFYLALNNSQPEVASATTVIPTDTLIPTPTVNPYKAPLEQQLSEVGDEIRFYQNDYSTTNNNLIVYKQNLQEPAPTQSFTNDSGLPIPNNASMTLNLSLEITNIEMQTITTMNNRLANDANKLDQLRQEQEQLEYELSQM